MNKSCNSSLLQTNNILQNHSFVLQQLPMASSNIFFPFLCLMYLFVVYIIGPNFMKKRAPLKQLKIFVIPVYNLLQVIANATLVILAFSNKSFLTASLDNLCGLKDMDFETSETFITFGYFWCLLKVSDFFDTFFFIALKKYSHVSFLHVYHHSTTMVVAFVLFRYLKLEQALVYAGVNCLVHVVMYSYYMLTSMGFKPAWKKIVTALQLVQFGGLLFMTISLLFTCQTKTKYISFSVFSLLQCLMYIYLFGKFYLTSYIKDYNDLHKNYIDLQKKL